MPHWGRMRSINYAAPTAGLPALFLPNESAVRYVRVFWPGIIVATTPRFGLAIPGGNVCFSNIRCISCINLTGFVAPPYGFASGLIPGVCRLFAGSDVGNGPPLAGLVSSPET